MYSVSIMLSLTTTVLVLGAFDLFHRGHVEFLKSARALGDRLVVAVNSDAKVAKYKRTPVIAETDRLAIVSAIRHVDHAEIVDGFSVRNLIDRHSPAVIVHGDDWTRERYLTQIGVTEEELASLGIRLELVPYYDGVSTTAIIQEIEDAA
ncbi:adenylyltransferase/cytidyltransferase family protein [Aureimonas psammosilenae]|uniref:adenylyltransferase/cytidyltransferase family protein n=1 Tax=Aureimonas psammosilenae TaxID=2495496 RepID=UPI001AED92CE|nr:adenylyltransferase/cytidyltransferase family protein [Aureimonas psammosilenae]